MDRNVRHGVTVFLRTKGMFRSGEDHKAYSWSRLPIARGIDAYRVYEVWEQNFPRGNWPPRREILSKHDNS